MTIEPTQHPEPALNPTALARLHELGGASLVARVLTAFVTEAADRLATGQRALGDRDAAGLAAAMHGHASAAAWLGADELLPWVRLGERQAREGDWPAVTQTVEAVERAMAAALAEAHRQLQQLSLEER